MGRVKAKGKKLSMTMNNHDDQGSGEEERIPTQKRRGRPQKPLKDDIDDDEAQKIEDEDSEDVKNKSLTQNAKKRKRNVQVKEKVDLVKEENANGIRLSSEETNRSNGFRQNGNRRKNKPRRAAEAVVECN
ncbi:hypothetical protein BUALT_Bualt13G0030600 [Buddleja alternifolia]|uniref:Uncharacterized protein n=1 Tax=Buddleja alternifolia TaxID=168488 RepID=A0AAV6WS13_9LAMI|nr:hypothetical protein BUALT_Bualt13G0030600 [Buddleja alternifolia]